MRLGELLTEAGVVSADQIDHAVAAQHGTPVRLGTILIRHGVVDPDVVAAALGKQKGVPAARRAHFENMDRSAAAKVDPAIARHVRAVPLGVSTKGSQVLVVAMADPDDIAAIDELQFASGMRVRPVAAPMYFIGQCLDQLYPEPEPKPEPVPSPEPEPKAQPQPAHDPFAPAPALLDPIPLANPSQAAKPATPTLAPETGPGAFPAGEPTSSAPSTAFQGTSESVYTIAGVAIALAGVLAFAIAVKSKGCVPDGSKGMDGNHYITHLGLEVQFPEEGGWKYMNRKNDSRSQFGITVKGSYFYRGGTSNDPDLALVVGLMDAGGRLPDPIPDQAFQRMLDGARQNMRTFGNEEMTLRAGQCEVVHLRTPQTGLCTGTATYKGSRRNLALYLWADSGQLIIAIVLTRDPLDEVRAEYEAIVGSIHVPRGDTADEPEDE